MRFTGTSFIPSLLLPVIVAGLSAQPIRVQQSQGSLHGFLVVRDAAGTIIGHGEDFQIAHGRRVTSRLVFTFNDGSVDEETTVYLQDSTFHLVSDHHTQKGPYFPHPTDLLIRSDGTITTRTVDKNGHANVEVGHVKMPDDVANGLVGTLILNVPAKGPAFSMGYIAPVGKGRAIKLQVAPDGQAHFTEIGVTHTANIFRLKVDLGGIIGVIAPIVGKQPDDTLLWILEGPSPAFVREISQLYEGAPLVSIELSGTTFPALDATKH